MRVSSQKDKIIMLSDIKEENIISIVRVNKKEAKKNMGRKECY